MRILLALSFIILLFSCSKNKGSCRLHSITHHASLGSDTLLYHYHPNGLISHITKKQDRIDYLYTNGYVTGRNLYFGTTLTRTDTITYDGSFILASIAMRYPNLSTYEKTIFTYNAGKLTAASTTTTTSSGTISFSATFEYNGNNISKVLYSPGSSIDSVTFTHKSGLNPLNLTARDNILTDPYFTFTGNNLFRISLFFSANPPASAIRYQSGTALQTDIDILTANSRIKFLGLPGFNEGLEYEYFCTE